MQACVSTDLVTLKVPDPAGSRGNSGPAHLQGIYWPATCLALRQHEGHRETSPQEHLV